VGAYAENLLREAKTRIQESPSTYLDLVNPLLKNDDWRFYTHRGSGQNETQTVFTDPLGEVPDSVERAGGIYVGHYLSREETVDLGAELVGRALDLVFAVWPIYRFYLAGTEVA